ncbi:uncharacterized protein LOC114734326 [Neltuma alba]|uniref:uncharacterized protein LOC114734326 n=1 Tax=Neltuma alba TaxID=207710 RepID=UPI0010A4AAAC|nr:uncharacterized protein LOC114734326 [Prosopis alba]
MLRAKAETVRFEGQKYRGKALTHLASSLILLRVSMDTVTSTDKRSKATSPNVASAEEIPESAFVVSCSKDSSQFLESTSSSDSSDASSLSLLSSSSFSDEPLHDFSEMLAQLPIKQVP